MTVAEELRAAAAKLREAAKDAEPGPYCANWTYSAIRHVQRNCDIDCDIHEGVWDGQCKRFGRYDGLFISLWHPAVALAVADSLDVMAKIAEYATERGYETNEQTAAALAMARAFVGGGQ